MANTVVLGMQWGDEGKGKIVDLICPAFDAVARYQGGHNAGHTVKFGDRHFALHFLPSGAVHGDVRCVLGNGMVIHPDAFFDELASLADNGVELGPDRLAVSDRAQLILPAHVALDRAREAARGDQAIGTTARGIGPTYETKAGRTGMRTGDLLADRLDHRVETLHQHLASQLRALGSDEIPTVDELVACCREWAERLGPFLCDTADELNDRIDAGGSVLFEGAQGALLDLDHGTYPFVTSSSATAGGVATGTGVPPTRLDGALGVIKAYTTRVGEGPFVTELGGDVEPEIAAHLQDRGNEFGTSTGRPRRCGWFDAVAARYSRRINGIDTMALTKLDVLDELDEIRVCTAYRYRGEELPAFPAAIEVLEEVEPIYETFPGWKTSTVGSLSVDDLPPAAQDYMRFLEAQVGAPVGIVSTGPRREETILVDSPEMRHLLGDALDQVLAERGTP
ncbi:MAG: adenylosuccinate synthase [Acidobacteriota bacterium]